MNEHDFVEETPRARLIAMDINWKLTSIPVRIVGTGVRLNSIG